MKLLKNIEIGSGIKNTIDTTHYVQDCEETSGTRRDVEEPPRERAAVLAAVARNGKALEAAGAFQHDRDVVLAAVRQNGARAEGVPRSRERIYALRFLGNYANLFLI